MTDRAQELVEVARRFARERVAPEVVERDREERYPRDLVREAGNVGLLGGTVPLEYGGTALSYAQYAAVLEEMARVDHLFALAMSLPGGLAGAGILRHGSEEQRRRFIPPMTAGESIAAVAITEPESGTTVADMHTTCRRVDDGYVLNGHKTWIAHVTVCDWILTFAMAEGQSGRDAVSAFMVPADAPGVRRSAFRNKLGYRAIPTGDIFFEDVHVAEENRIGPEGGGFGIAMTSVETSRFGAIVRQIGVAQDCLDRSVAHARARTVDGTEIGRFQLVQSMITDMVLGIEGARGMLRRLCELRDQGARARGETSLAKLHASDVALLCATHAVQIHGASGVHEDSIVERHFRDGKVFQIIEGQNQLHRVMVAEYALGYRRDA
jgi:alkylation response protein AidB-like acyl-CoA dehydrogenase